MKEDLAFFLASGGHTVKIGLRGKQLRFDDLCLIRQLSTDARTLYGILLDRMGLSVKNGWLDEQGRVYIIFPVQEVMDALGCADNKATKLFRELEKFGLIERTRLEAYFMQSLEVDLLLRVCPDDEDTIYQIVDLLVDTCSTKRKLLRVAGDDKPAEVVRRRFMKLNRLL